MEKKISTREQLRQWIIWHNIQNTESHRDIETKHQVDDIIDLAPKENEEISCELQENINSFLSEIKSVIPVNIETTQLFIELEEEITSLWTKTNADQILEELFEYMEQILMQRISKIFQEKALEIEQKLSTTDTDLLSYISNNNTLREEKQSKDQLSQELDSIEYTLWALEELIWDFEQYIKQYNKGFTSTKAGSYTSQEEFLINMLNIKDSNLGNTTLKTHKLYKHLHHEVNGLQLEKEQKEDIIQAFSLCLSHQKAHRVEWIHTLQWYVSIIDQHNGKKQKQHLKLNKKLQNFIKNIIFIERTVEQINIDNENQSVDKLKNNILYSLFKIIQNGLEYEHINNHQELEKYKMYSHAITNVFSQESSLIQECLHSIRSLWIDLDDFGMSAIVILEEKKQLLESLYLKAEEKFEKIKKNVRVFDDNLEEYSHYTKGMIQILENVFQRELSSYQIQHINNFCIDTMSYSKEEKLKALISFTKDRFIKEMYPFNSASEETHKIWHHLENYRFHCFRFISKIYAGKSPRKSENIWENVDVLSYFFQQKK